METLTISTAAITGGASNSIFNVNTTGTGTLNMAAQSTYNGATSLNGGTLNLGVSSVGGVTSGPIGTGNLIFNGGTLTASSGGISIANTFTVGGTATNSYIAGTNALTLSNSGVFNSGDTLQITNSSNTTLSGGLSGAGALTENTVSGTLSIGSGFSFNNAYYGDITLSRGTLQIANDASVDPLGNGHLYLNGGTISAASAVTANPIVNAFTIGAGDTVTLAGANAMVFSGAGIMGNGSTLNDNGTGGNSFTGGLSLSAASNAAETINVGANEIFTVATTAITGGASNSILNVNTAGSGTLNMNAQSTYNGTTSLNGGSLNLGVSSIGAITSGPLGQGSLVFNGGTLTASSGGISIANNFYGRWYGNNFSDWWLQRYYLKW